jgi:hypothetical protein
MLLRRGGRRAGRGEGLRGDRIDYFKVNIDFIMSRFWVLVGDEGSEGIGRGNSLRKQHGRSEILS